ncbi:caspase, EACC1-associated type [Streptomyces canus]|uniref:WD40 repeat protein n=1 Tax=Streptomyces canus TaxID=58343 RepID=A0AAW8FFG4_9ACTN|nr:caspase family protein [Streptomyces canus]MDQ0763070.1 WD40 repeat protein [Streptomyces canus]MDQ0908474.1 WD40 repeat protein [Streptomyces canus]
MGRRIALLIATYEYQDTGLRQLTSPAHDAEALAEVLRDPDIAGFEVTTLVNQPHHVVGEAIGDFYRGRRSDDLALLYFTGHGLKDQEGRLYLAMSNSRRDSLLFTALSAEQLDRAIEGCVSRQKVLILDCCYAGAFGARGTKGDTSIQALERFQGRGRTVLTATDATQYSFEGNEAHGHAAQSVFTRHLVEGLRDGSADLDGDGDITLDELYSYVHDRVVEEMPQQRPKRQDNVEGRTVIASNINWTLPAYLRNAIGSPLAQDRLGALDGLVHLHRIGNDRVRTAVAEELRHLTDDDSKLVSRAAAERLRALVAPPDAVQVVEPAPRPAQPTTPQAVPPPAPERAPEPPPQPTPQPRPHPAQPARSGAASRRPPSASPPVPATERPSAPPPRPAPTRSLALPRSRRARVVLAGATALAVAVTVVSLVLAYGGGDSDSSSSGSKAMASASSISPSKTLSGAGTDVEFSADGKTLVTSDGETVKAWQGSMTEPSLSLSKRSFRALSPDGRLMATEFSDGKAGNGEEVAVRDLDTGDTTTLHTDAGSLVAAFSPDGKTLATARTTVAEESLDTPVRLWNTETGKLRLTLTGHTNGVGSMDFTPDGKVLVTASTDHTVRLWNPATGKSTRTLGGGADDYVYNMVLSPDGTTIATWGGTASTQLWNRATGERTIDVGSPGGGVFSPDSTLFAYSSGTGVRLRSVDPTVDSDQTARGGVGRPFRFSPDSKTIATNTYGSNDPAVLVWDVTTGVHTATLPGGSRKLTSLAFTPNGQTLATADEGGTVSLWKVP